MKVSGAPALEELLDAALDTAAPERRRVLEGMGGDPELIDEALALVGGEGSLGSFLAVPAAESLTQGMPAAGAEPPEVAGFTFLRLLGSGGMGEVWLARQTEPADRLVAVKSVRRSLWSLSGRDRERRFAAEQRALARLNHPAVAHLYDVGVDPRGRPYVVMEYVEGEPITTYCRSRRLSTGDRLRLFVTVCRGVSHAHRRQLLHLDLKPPNVLVTEVDGRPAAKIIDFGIAQILDAPLDEAAPVFGTPRYMSPEALATDDGRDVDTRADVYSLGVLLRELLTGDPAPDRPVDGDLGWVVRAATADDPEARYGSAAELADDVERFLAAQPLVARPASWTDRVGKLVRRNRLTTTMLGVALAVAITAAVMVSVALVRATEAERVARAEARATEQTLDFLVALFEAARPEQAEGREVTARDLVAAGIEELDARDLPPLQRARLLHTLADVEVRLGSYDEARRLALEALSLRESAPVDASEILASLDLLGVIERQAGRLDAAAPYLERQMTLATAGGEPRVLAGALNSLGNLRWAQGDLGAGEALHRRALALREEVWKSAGTREAALDVAASRNNVGVLLWTDGRPEEAEPFLRGAAEELRQALGSDDPRVATAWGNLGLVLADLERYDEALVLQQRVLELRRATLGDGHPLTGTAHHNLGFVLVRLSRFAEAEPQYRAALDIRLEALGAEHPETVKTRYALFRLMQRWDRPDRAEPFRKALLERPDLLSDARLRALREAATDASE